MLRLPSGAGFELQLRYGSIGWSVGATLGYALGAAGAGRRVVALIGDGSFQMTAQVCRRGVGKGGRNGCCSFAGLLVCSWHAVGC
jgi:TPP-dependent 2-oxoacid decarboxylase